MSLQPPLASLPMYDWPEERAAVDALFAAMRAQDLGDLLPTTLTRPDDMFAQWRDPALVLSQTCWGPLTQGLVPDLVPIAQPDYSAVPGGMGPLYRSAIIAQRGANAGQDEGQESGQDKARGVPPPVGRAAVLPAMVPGVFAYNAAHSLSGVLGLAQDLGVTPDALTRGGVETGGHRGSVRAVAQGRAEFAAIDCQSWVLAQRHEPCARALIVVGWTAARPGLPYVTHRATPAQTVIRLRNALITLGCHEIGAHPPKPGEFG